MIFGAKSVGKSIFLTISAIILLFLMLACVSTTLEQPVVATDNSARFYYSHLSSDEQKIYDAMRYMHSQQSLELGSQEYDLTDAGVVSSEQAQNYANGDRSLLKSFERARNAFCMEQNVFYVDFSKFELSVGLKENKYVVTMGTGRNSDYYRDGFSSQEEVTVAKDQYDSALQKLVNVVKTSDSNVDKIRSANTQILNSAIFGYGTNESGSVIAKTAGQITTNYGALVNGVAVYEGYARLMRDVLNALNIENMLVSGYVLNENECFVPAMWNYVKLGDSWYAVDCAMNDLSEDNEEFLLVGQDKMRYQHYFANDSMSELAKNCLSATDYDYVEPIEINFGQQPSTMSVSYLGKNATELAKQGLYLSFRIKTAMDGGETKWVQWASLSAKVASNDETGYYENVMENANSTTLTLPNSALEVQFAVINVAPNASGEYEKVQDNQIVTQSKNIINQDIEASSTAPTAKKVVPSNAEVLDADKTYTIVIVYDEPLSKGNADEPIGVTITSARGEEVAPSTQVFWSSTNDSDTVSFSFTASALFNDNYQTYSFAMKNLVGTKSQKEPNIVSMTFQKFNVNLSKYAENQSDSYISLSPNNNLDLTTWKYKAVSGTIQNGDNAYLNQLSFVSSAVNSLDAQQMVTAITQQHKLRSDDIYSTSSYNINLNLCGGEVTFNNGKMLKIELPRVVSNLNYRAFVCQKKNDGTLDLANITELQTFVNGDKLVIETNKFGSLVVVATFAQANAQQRVLYVNNVNKNGVIFAQVNGIVQTDIIPLNLDESVIVRFTPNVDYILSACLLSGKMLVVKDNQVIISYNDLRESNVLDVCFVANSVANSENKAGLLNLQNEFLTNQYVESGINVGLVVCLAVCGAVLLGLMITWLVVFVKNERQEKLARKMGF